MEKALSRAAGVDAVPKSRAQSGSGFLVRLIEEPVGTSPLMNAAEPLRPTTARGAAYFASDARGRACDRHDDILTAFWHEMSDLLPLEHW